MRRLILSLMLLAAAPALAAPSLPKGMPYAQARKSLIAQGYEPWIFPGGGDCTIGRESICRRYRETWSCSGTGLAHCSMIYTRGGTGIEVVTSGEDRLVIHRVVSLSEEDYRSFTAD